MTPKQPVIEGSFATDAVELGEPGACDRPGSGQARGGA
jgi:hypothetical protein